ncbi:SDR family oxidoreductase [Sodalis ligni]|jgi:3-oxoacyl-[acyl-carrier protein] reductase|uniref:3-oxoacyl-[acyl-carrier protein] reductase n=1 Tax=Sodalis ligni TaxID=2697027 RepID=A0A4R1NFI7_9GAMM|nr:SDR family NAD(P)-dependent oxidoreductase [Sodalis ligni]QWA10925.1 SDR family oxidoreductase [Sodalis ligni]TCL05717.1 3-oxoacyl-[acyl-carrier protein] reductase [Sodalis ligni]
MSAELSGRVAVVTGAARNIGRAMALELAAAGAAVVVNAKQSADAAAGVVEDIERQGGQALLHLADISGPEGAQSLMTAALHRFGKIDILVNNAAIRREVPFAQLDWTQWREVLAVILDGAFLCASAALPALRQAGEGTIINIGGMSAHAGSAGRAHVMAAKAGLVGLTRALAHDLGPDGITVNCVVPGMINTARGAAAGNAEPAHHAVHSTLLGRRGTPKDIADLVRFLSGPHARYLTGQVIHANGGAFLP